MQSHAVLARSSRASEEPRLQVGGIGAIHDALYYKTGIRVTGFGRLFLNSRGNYADQDWSLRVLSQARSTQLRSSLFRYLPEIARNLGVSVFLAPSPVLFNGQACSERDLTIAKVVGNVVLHRGAQADICPLAQGQAMLISAGGCAGGWMSHPGYDESGAYRIAAGAHLGLKSIESGVIPNMAKVLGISGRGRNVHLAHAGYAFPIDPMQYEHRWDHQKFGKQNRIRCLALVEKYGPRCVIGWDTPGVRELGRIDLGFIVREEFEALGIPPGNIHGTPSYDAFPAADGLPLWHTTRGRHRKRRNLIIIHHTR